METTMVVEQGFTIDYVKFIVRTEHDRTREFYDDWQAARAMVNAPAQGRGGDGFRSLGKDADGMQRYVFEQWGPSASLVLHLDYGRWNHFLERLDVNRPMEVTTEGLDALYTHLTDEGKSRHNIQRFSSRIRNKRDGRDAGGEGLAIGSHKSDFRMSIYKRGHEGGRCEFQITGAMLTEMRALCKFYRGLPDEPQDIPTWPKLIGTVALHASVHANKALGLSHQQMESVMSNVGALDRYIENALADTEARIKTWPRAMKEALSVALAEQLRLDL